MKTALITGITGQDGSYLAELLLSKGYQVAGLVRRNSSESAPNIDHIRQDIKLYHGDLTDSSNLRKIVDSLAPDEVYNLAAQSHVGMSFTAPEVTGDINGLGVLRLLEALQSSSQVRFYQASTSELYGQVASQPQNEQTVFHPRSPYGVAKLFGYWITVNYRESYAMHASNGILFNHESPRRGEHFVTRKITLGLARVLAGLQEHILLGNVDAKRDWGHAQDYVEGMWLMCQQPLPGDYVLATGEQHSVREFCDLACQYHDIKLEWYFSGTDEIGINYRTGQTIFKIDKDLYRPADVNTLLGDSSLAREKLGWTPKHTINTLVDDMCSHDIRKVNNQ